MSLRLSTGSALVVARINRIDRDFVRGVRRAWFRSGDLLVRQIRRDILHKPKTGNLYRIKRGRRVINHIASAPGETAANLSGVYRRSMGYQIYGWRRLEFGSRSGSAPYARYLETGTSRMRARPGLGNAIGAQYGAIQASLYSAILSELSR